MTVGTVVGAMNSLSKRWQIVLFVTDTVELYDVMISENDVCPYQPTDVTIITNTVTMTSIFHNDNIQSLKD